ncbi:hypothetical protein [Solibacillus sp. FSL K6-1523]|uniref:hypothetical protein n=1 Tax=Solibacillus sp. FSL K6-1523 TaxID=2921471 RepID=UPI0030F5A787
MQDKVQGLVGVIDKETSESDHNITGSFVENTVLLEQLNEQNELFEKEVKAFIKENRTKAFNNALESANLSSFKGIENIDNLSQKEQIEFIQKAVNEILVQHSYNAKDVAQQDAFAEVL